MSGSHVFSIKFWLCRMPPLHFCRLIFLNLWWYLRNTNVILEVTSFFYFWKTEGIDDIPTSMILCLYGILHLNVNWPYDMIIQYNLDIWPFSLSKELCVSLCKFLVWTKWLYLTAIYLESRVISLYHLNSGTRKRHAERNISFTKSKL